MTIKEVEQRLDVPRATVRFYEKEGLLSPTRSENGYREYSEEDVVLLKKIIIFRKLGFAVSDIEDVLDGAKPMSEALKSNIENLTWQMQELQGAMALCRKMQENGEQIETFDAERYWNAVEEEEKKGNRFLDIAKDVVRFEKGIVLEIFGLVDFDGKPRDKWSMMFGCGGFIFGILFAWGIVRCLPLSLSRKFVLQRTVLGILIAVIIFSILKIPVCFLAKKNPKIRKYRKEIWVVLWIVVVIAFGIMTWVNVSLLRG